MLHKMSSSESEKSCIWVDHFTVYIVGRTVAQHAITCGIDVVRQVLPVFKTLYSKRETQCCSAINLSIPGDGKHIKWNFNFYAFRQMKLKSFWLQIKFQLVYCKLDLENIFVLSCCSSGLTAKRFFTDVVVSVWLSCIHFISKRVYAIILYT